MDVKEIAGKIVPLLLQDKKLLQDFEANPAKTIESIIKKDIPDDVVNMVVSAVKAAVSGNKAGGLLDSVKKMF